MKNITYKFGNNFENEAGAVTITTPALMENEGLRGSTPPQFIVASEEYISFSVPADCIVKNFYLVVEDGMVGTVDVYLGTVADGTQLFTGSNITAVGIEKSTIEDAYVTTPNQVSLVFSDNQTAGSCKVAFDVIFLGTNTSKYVGR